METNPRAGRDMVTLPRKRCGTCIERKISCDRRLPRCSSCIRSNRACAGYGVRLSWPKKHDGKRMIVGQAGPLFRGTWHTDPSTGQCYMVNATFWDIEVHQRRNSTRNGHIPPLYRFSSQPTSGLPAAEQDLLHFFQSEVAVGLSSFSNKPLGPTLLRLAASDDSFAAVALRCSLLAIASLFLYGPGVRGEELKLSAIRALAASAAQGIEPRNAIQHVAAGMVLCLFESQQSSTASSQWLCYLRAAGQVIESVSLESFGKVTDGPIMLEWIYYHEVLARFSIRHWRQHGSVTSSHPFQTELPSYLIEERNRCSSAVFAPIHLLSRAVAEVLPSRDPDAQQEAYKTRVARLREEISNLRVPTLLGPAAYRTAARAEVFRISALVYLSRSTDQDLRPSELRLLVDRGLCLLKDVGFCERPLPLLILGGEAHTDVERLRVLDLVPTEKSRPPSPKPHFIRMLLQALWIQNDLDSESNVELDYTEKLSAVFGASESPPHFH
ncbi:hypothetical protein LX36DRAFT_459088 [Colletotrichum falcatum]|nr:hypothetical protein LX36DRAFT_459088 [Colletotrichum falcatum]